MRSASDWRICVVPVVPRRPVRSSTPRGTRDHTLALRAPFLCRSRRGKLHIRQLRGRHFLSLMLLPFVVGIALLLSEMTWNMVLQMAVLQMVVLPTSFSPL